MTPEGEAVEKVERPEVTPEAIANGCPYCEQSPCRNVDHALGQAAYFATVSNAAFDRAEQAEAALTPAHPEGGSAGARVREAAAHCEAFAAWLAGEAGDNWDALSGDSAKAIRTVLAALAATPEPPASHSEGAACMCEHHFPDVPPDPTQCPVHDPAPRPDTEGLSYRIEQARQSLARGDALDADYHLFKAQEAAALASNPPGGEARGENRCVLGGGAIGENGTCECGSTFGSNVCNLASAPPAERGQARGEGWLPSVLYACANCGAYQDHPFDRDDEKLACCDELDEHTFLPAERDEGRAR